MYQSTHTGAQVDEAVDKVLASPISMMSNRNLLDNGWFTVNQRGQASYTSAGYTVDRWKLNIWQTTSQSVTVNTNGITLSGTASGANTCMLTQKIENYAALAGKTVTVSVLTGSASGNIGVYYSYNNGSSWSRVINALSANSYNSGTWTIQSGISGLSIAIGKYASDAGSGNTDIDTLAVKLELGSVSTLANDVAPNYAEELAKCQRYCYVVKAPATINLTLCAANAYDANNVYAGVSVPPQMRTPTLSLSSSSALKFGTSGFTITPSSVSMYGYAAGIATIQIAATSLTAGTTYRVGLMNGESIIFSADL